MSHSVLKTVSQLEGIHIVEPVLHVGVNNQLGQTQNLTTQVKGISKPGLISLLGSQDLDWLEIEIVVEMEIVEVLHVNEHVVALPAHL